MSFSSPAGRTPALALLLLTAAAVSVHGYHLGADDAAIYVPAIKQAADPTLYPFGAEFFQSHARLTLLPVLVGGSARLAHLPVDCAIFGWHALGVFLLLLGAWRLASACFEQETAKWTGVAMLAAVLAVPVAGTALSIADPYVTSRTLSTPATLLAIAGYLSGRTKEAWAWWLLAAVVHPQMGFYAAVFLLFLALRNRQGTPLTQSAASLPFVFDFEPARGPAREALLSRTFFFVSQWAWYEWLGVVAPLALLAWFSRGSWRGTRPAFGWLASSLVPFGLLFTLASIVLDSSPHLENYTRIQPMRSLHLVYAVFFILLGGLLGEYVIRGSRWRWPALFAPLAIAMWFVAEDTYPASAHVELPGLQSHNAWLDAFFWIRENTPRDAVFALDPAYMKRPDEDMHGFRAVAERSALADEVKDSGAVSLFPGLAEDWKSQVRITQGWRSFRLADFEGLARQYPVTWLLIDLPSAASLDCPYRNQTLAVCHMPAVGAESTALKGPIHD